MLLKDEEEEEDEEEVEVNEPEEEEEEEDEEEEDEFEVEEIKFDDSIYYTNDSKNGVIFEYLEDAEIGDEIGYLKNGKLFIS